MRDDNFYTGVRDAFKKSHRSPNGHEKLDLGKKIRELREEAGISGAELCRRSGGVDPRTLNAIEKGRIRTPSIDTLQAIAAGLGCLVRDLFTQAEIELNQNYHRGSAKGFYQVEFPKRGVRIISLVPAIPQFFCGKVILAPRAKLEGEIPARSCPLFIEVVLGKVEFGIEEEIFALNEGENLLFNGGLRHWFRNPANRESVLWIVTAPSFFRA